MQESRGLRRITLSMLGVVAACSGASTSDFFGPGGGSPAAGGDAGRGGDATVGGPAESKDGGTRKDGSTPDASVKSDATAVDGAGSDVNVQPSDPGVFCGVDSTQTRKYCDVSSQFCCVTDNGGELTFACKSKSGPSCAGLEVPCSDQSDCGGTKICCATYDNVNQGYASVACQDSCEKDTLTETEFRLCDHDAPTDECDAIGKSCSSSSAVPGWFVCK